MPREVILVGLDTSPRPYLEYGELSCARAEVVTEIANKAGRNLMERGYRLLSIIDLADSIEALKD